MSEEKQSKPWYKSRTIQIAILQAAAGMITAGIAMVEKDSVLTGVGVLLVVKSGLDSFIRSITNTPIKK